MGLMRSPLSALERLATEVNEMKKINKRNTLFMLALVAAASFTLTAIYLSTVPSVNSQTSAVGALENNQAQAAETRNSSDGLTADTYFNTYPIEKTIDAAQGKVSLFNIRVPSQTNMPADYKLVAAIPIPVGAVHREHYTNRTFRPQQVVLLYWNKSLPTNMSVNTFYNEGGVFVVETFSLGVNSTEPYLNSDGKVPANMTVGWFHGYPGIWSEGYAEAFQLNKNMAYSVQSKLLTKDQALGILATLLAQ